MSITGPAMLYGTRFATVSRLLGVRQVQIASGHIAQCSIVESNACPSRDQNLLQKLEC